MSIKTPLASTGGLQAVIPIRNANAPITVSNVSQSSDEITSDAFYIYVTTPCHVRISANGDAADTIHDFPIASSIGHIFCCNIKDKISVVKQNGMSDGLAYIHSLQKN